MKRAAALMLLLVGGCGSSAASDPSNGRVGDLEAGLRALNRSIGVTTAFIFTGVVAANSPPETIASAIYQRFKSETGGCAPATLNGALVDCDLSAGCTLASTNQIYKGTIHAEAQKPMGEVVIPLTLDLTVDGQPLKGTVEIHTTDGNAFTYKGDLTLGPVHVVMPFLRAGVGGFGSSVSAMGTLTGKSAPTAPGLTVMVNGVHQRFAGCFPDDGNAVVTAPMVNDTVTFASDAPQSGLAMLTHGGPPIVVTLPARPGCPQK